MLQNSFKKISALIWKKIRCFSLREKQRIKKKKLNEDFLTVRENPIFGERIFIENRSKNQKNRSFSSKKFSDLRENWQIFTVIYGRNEFIKGV